MSDTPVEKPTVTEFVRSLPATMPAKEIVEKGKAAGLTISKPYIYILRSRTKQTGRKSPKKHSMAKPKLGNQKAEDLLRAAAAELGLANAMAILQSDHDLVLKMLRE